MTHELNTPVRITHTPCRYFGHVGTVVEVVPTRDFPYGVGGLEDWLLWFGDGELVKVAPEGLEAA